LASIGNLSTGTYSVTVTDELGCTATKSTSLTAPTPLVVTYDTSSHHGFAVSCNGGNDGAINLTVSGGVTPYSFN
jgi:large repetitive protein